MKMKILIVDDDSLVRHTLKSIFDALGHETLIASCFDEALAIIEQDRPDVFFIDWWLDDGHNGFEIASVIQDNLPNARTAVISGCDVGDVRKERPGNLDVTLLEKPISFKDLCKSVALDI